MADKNDKEKSDNTTMKEVQDIKVEDNLQLKRGKAAQQNEKSKHFLNDDPGSTSIKWEGDKGEKPPFMTRMIDSNDEDVLWNFNSHLELQNLDCNTIAVMRTEEEFKVQRKIQAEKNRRNYFVLAVSVLSCLIIIAIEVLYILIALTHFKYCGYIDSYLITSAVFHMVIVITEWFRQWMWNLKSHRNSRGGIHLFQYSSAMMLACLYFFCGLWYTIGFAWIMVPYTESLEKSDKEKIYIFINGKKTHFIPVYCDKWFYHAAIMYQLYTFSLIIVRLVMVGFSQFCKGLCVKLSTSTSLDNTMSTPYVASNELNDILPPVSTYRIMGYRERNYFPRTVHGDAVCMIPDHPKWREM